MCIKMAQTRYQKATVLSINAANCLNIISPAAACRTCQDICPQQALSWQNNQWHTADCTLCGLCTSVCPTQVFQIDQNNLFHLKTNGPLHLCCARDTDAPAEAVALNCLQQLTPLLLIHLLYQTQQQIILHLPAAQCQQCGQQWYPQGLQLQLEQYQLPSEKLQIVIQTEQPSGQNAASSNQRREFLRDIFHRTESHSKKMIVQTAEQLAANFESVQTQNTEPAVFPVRLPLYALYIKKQLPIFPERTLPFHQLGCSSCTFCGACVHVCPTQALTMQEDQQEKQLLYQPELCINCNLCQQICMKKGLYWNDFMTQKQFLQTPWQLAHSSQKICSQCGHDYYQWPDTDQTRCSFCQR